jgi:hypothetical protein
MTTVHARTPSPAAETFAPAVARGDGVQRTGSVSPSPPDSLSAGSGSPAPSSLSSQCDAGVDLVRWEEGGEGEDGNTTATAAATATCAEAEGAKTEEGWGVAQEKKAPPDVVSQPAREPLPP